MDTIERSARLSPCGRYRYSLSRTWDRSTPPVAFIMLNPSTADAEHDDPTIRRCMGFARRWGAGGIRVVNLYAWRATKPADLKPINPLALVAEPMHYGQPLNQNDSAIISAAGDASRIVVAWGAWPGPWPHRTHRVADLLEGRHVEALALTKDGAPRHPLYVRGDVDPVTYWGAPSGA